ncbi:integrin beta-1-binding protein 2 isoform X1 [Rhinatrema bivittatum]|uniref:integrin beta-1-binding protein 2 isoform X1 n=1 Tax=Rhinatrema bivittatum TaxID=194408 RepID=UPI00112E09BF|nr:integrin beta-1-binding protein 2 isoform X1 [Rhinatrema bivittatum]
MSMDGEICSQRPATSKTCNSGPALPLLCYNKGCGKTFTEEQNSEESCLYHPGVPIFHDALKGWSCCRKRTTDFSEFLTIKGCTKGHHNSQKPLELLQPEVTSSKQLPDQLGPSWSPELIVQGPKSAEKLQRERPSSEEPKEMLVKKVSQMLMQALEKMNLVSEEKSTEQEETASLVDVGSKCQNSGCKEIYKGSESETEVCVFHPGIPVFHEGMKYWSCCAIKTTDFNTFLEQKGCSTAKHTWKKKEDKKMVSCRQDWHQTSGQVVVTVYAKNPLPELCSVQANRTGLDICITFEKSKVFQKTMNLWGVIDTEKSFIIMLPTKVEITLKKADLVTWGKLELPQPLLQKEVAFSGCDLDGANAKILQQEECQDSEDSLSWSEEEEENLSSQ